MLHHGVSKLGKPYYSYGIRGKKMYYNPHLPGSAARAKARALKLAHRMAIRGSALVGGEGAGGEGYRRRRRVIHRRPRRHLMI